MPHPARYPAPASIGGLPTQEELDALPRLFSWERLQEIIASGELGDLKRNVELQQRYDRWTKGIRERYGSTENYLISVRLPWKMSSPPSLNAATAKLKIGEGRMDNHLPDTPSITPGGGAAAGTDGGPGPSTPHENYFTFARGEAVDDDLVAILPNDWPYNVPYGVTHTVIWSKLPLFHPALVGHDSSKWAKVVQEGFAGRTGSPDSGRDDWYTEGGNEIDTMTRTLWPEDEFECLWFVNPPRLQSVRGLSHFHVFARAKREAQP